MKQRELVFLAVAGCTLILAGCSNSNDDGGSSAGSGALPYCERDAGVYNYSDGSRFELKPNCEFIITASDGNYGHGGVTSVNKYKREVTADFIYDTGPSKGTCGTITVTETVYHFTNVHQCI